MQQEIEDRALKLLALRQPMAVDLRETLAAIKIASRAGAHRRSGQEHRQARPGAEPRTADPADPIAWPAWAAPRSAS